MTTLTDLAQTLRDTSSHLWTACHGTNPPVMQKAMSRAVVDLDTVANQLYRTAECSVTPEGDLDLALLLSAAHHRWTRGDVRGGQDALLEALSYVRTNALVQERAAGEVAA